MKLTELLKEIKIVEPKRILELKKFEGYNGNYYESTFEHPEKKIFDFWYEKRFDTYSHDSIVDGESYILLKKCLDFHQIPYKIGFAKLDNGCRFRIKSTNVKIIN